MKDETHLKEKLKKQQNDLAALLSRHQVSAGKSQKKVAGVQSNSRNNSGSSTLPAPPSKSTVSTKSLNKSSKGLTTSPAGKTFYQDQLSERINYEDMLRQANLDHEAALKKQEKEMDKLRNRIVEQRDVLDMAVLREKSVKYYGSLLTSSVDAALLGNNQELTEETKRYLSKVTSTLNYLLNDGNITHSIEKEVTESENNRGNNANIADVDEDKKIQAVKASIKNRRGSINVVPFESAMLYDQPPAQQEEKNADDDVVVTKRAVSKSRRGTLNAVPLSAAPPKVTSTPHATTSSPGTTSLMRLLSIDDVGEEESGDDDESNDESLSGKLDNGQPQGVAAVSTSLAPVICQCQQLIPYVVLSNSFEDKCSALFQTVYKRSCMGFNEKSKTVEVQVPHEKNPVNQWIGKSAFITFLFNTGNIDSNLTLQASIYCFDKAANANATRSRYKLNMRIYYEDFIAALSSAAMFKYPTRSQSSQEDERREKIEKLVAVSSQAFAIKNEMVYYELSNIFKYLKSPDFFTTMSNSQLILLKAYKRCVNYACTHTGFQGNQKRQWPSNTGLCVCSPSLCLVTEVKLRITSSITFSCAKLYVQLFLSL